MYQDIEDMTKEQQVKNAGIYLIPTIISTILPIISLPIILRYLSPEEFGSYALSLAFASVVVGFCQFSLLIVFERNFFAYEDKREQILFTIVSFIFFIIITVGILIYYNMEILAEWFIRNQKQGLLLFFTFCGWAIFEINNYFLSYLKNSGNAKFNVGFTVSGNILGVLLNIYFVSILQIGPLGLAFGLLLSNSLIFIIANIYFIRRIPYSFNHELLISSLKLSLPLVPPGLLSSVSKQFDKYIIGIIASVGGAGVYAIGQRLSNITSLFMVAIQKVYAPIVYHKMFSNNYMDGDNEIGEYLTPFAYFSVSAALFLSLFSEEVLIIMAPPEYLQGVSVINLLCIRFAVSFFAKQPQIMYAGKTIILSVLSFVHFFLTIIILYFFVNYFGLIGAAAGVLLVSIIYASLYIWKGQQYYKIQYEWLKLSFIYGMLVIMSVSTSILFELGYVYSLRFLLKTLYGFLFIGLGMYLRILTKNNLLLILFKRNGN